MKFLKTFLFTISLTFFSFGIVTLKGFCTSIALTPDTSTVQAVQSSGFNGFALSQNFGEMYFMSEEFNYQFMHDLGEILSSDANSSVANGYGLPNFGGLNNGDLALANGVSNLMTKGLMNYAQLLGNGYSIVSHVANQWGTGVKEYFVAKVDETTGVISDAIDNVVVKVSEQGINKYLGYSGQFVSDGIVDEVSDLSFKYGKSISFGLYDSSNNIVGSPCVINFPDNYLVFSSNKYLYIALPYPTNSISVTGFYISNNSKIDFTSISTSYYTYQNEFDVNGVRYCLYRFTINGYTARSNIEVFPIPSSYNSIVSFASDYLNNSPSAPLAYIYNYSDSTSLALQNLLEQLVDRYVDSNTMDKIIDKLRDIPIVVDNSGSVAVPVAEADSSLLDEISTLIDEAVANSLIYEAVLDTDVDITPVPSPTPDNEYQGTAVPEGFPTTIFSPINDSVGSMFDFVSIFEPLFYIFSFSSGLLGLWFVVPFVILFLILFRLLK